MVLDINKLVFNLADSEQSWEDYFDLRNLINQRSLQILMLCVFSMLLAQLLKFIILSIKRREVAWFSLITTGGFPSSHTSICMTLVTSLLMFQLHDLKGTIDWSFVVAVVFSFIIIHDAMGVRLEASRHAKILNKFTEERTIEERKELGFGKKGQLKEMLGHRGNEVFGGILIGILVGIIGFVVFV